MYHNNQWGTVCDGGWDISDAEVVCRQLGFPGAYSAVRNAHFGQGNGTIWLDNVNCGTDHNSIFSCLHNGWGVHNCGHGDDAGVVCHRKCFHRTLGNSVTQKFLVYAL